jgi:hypothetical protein
VISHGKSAATDEVGGTLKGLQKKPVCGDKIMTPHQLYECAKSTIHNLNFEFVTENE